MNGVELKITKPKHRLATGSSKLFGNPAIWDGFEWPYIKENSERYDLTFMCQINCAQASCFDESGLLPKTGMLYFFYDLDTMPEMPSEKSARVLWYNGDLSSLHEMILTDESGNSLAFSEQEIEFEATDTTTMRHSLLESTKLYPSCDNNGIDSRVCLLCLSSFETEDAEIRFCGNKRLCYYIERNKLAAHDFSEVKAAQSEL